MPETFTEADFQEAPTFSESDFEEPKPEVPDTFATQVPLTRAQLAAKQIGSDPSSAFSPFVPLGPDIKAQSLPGQILAAPYNVAKGFLEGMESRGGVALLPTSLAGKAAAGAVGVGFGLPAIKQGLQRVYSGTATGETQEALEGALQTITGGLITVGAAKPLVEEAAKILPKSATEATKPIERTEPSASEISKTTEIHGDVQPQQEPTSPLPEQEGGQGVQPQAQAGIQQAQREVLLSETPPSAPTGEAQPSAAPGGATVETPVSAGETPQAKGEVATSPPTPQASTVTEGVTEPSAIKGSISFEELDEPSGQWKPVERPYIISKNTIPGGRAYRMTVFGGPKDDPVPIGHIETDSPTRLRLTDLRDLSEQLGRYTRKYDISDFKLSGESYFHKPKAAEPPPTIQGMGGVIPQGPGEPTGPGAAPREGEIPETGEGADIYGIAQRVREERAAAGQSPLLEPGGGVSGKEAVLYGQSLLKKDPLAADKAVKAFEKDRSTSYEGIAAVRAQGEAAFAEARRIEQEKGTDSPEYRAASEYGAMWDKASKDMQTEWHKQGMAQQGHTDLDTGSFTGLQRAFRESTDKDFTEGQAKKAKQIAEQSNKASQESKAAKEKLADAIGREPRIDPYILGIAERIGQKLKTEADAARERIKSRLGSVTFGSGPLHEIPNIKDYAIIGAEHIYSAGLDFAKWSARMVGEFGKNIEPHLESLFKESQKLVDFEAESAPEKPNKAEVKKAIRSVSAKNAERAALDAAHKTVREAAVEIAKAETKRRVAKTKSEIDEANVQKQAAEKAIKSAQNVVKQSAERTAKEARRIKEQPELDEQEQAAKKALDAANEVAKRAAKAVADAENKERVADAASKENSVQVEATQKALEAARETVKKAAAQIAKEERSRKPSEPPKSQEIAARKALQAAQKATKDAARKAAEAERKASVSKAEQEKKSAQAQKNAAQKALDAAQKTVRDAAAKAAELERKRQADPIGRVWDKAREYLNEGVDTLDELRNKVATDLGMTTEQVTRYLARNKTVKRLMDDAWNAQQKDRLLKAKAKRWLMDQQSSPLVRYASKIPRTMFAFNVGFHGTVALGTHAPMVAFQPKYWGTYMRDFVNMYKMVGSPTFYESQIQDLVRRPDWTTARRAGLQNDPHQYEEFNSPEISQYFGRLSGMGNRGYTILKILRQDMFDQTWNKLDKHLKTDEMAKQIAGTINHVTGVTQTKPVRGAHIALFAPRLLMSRGAWLITDPAKAVGTFINWKNATPEERFFAVHQMKEKATVAAVGYGLLLANQGILKLVGSKQQVNLTDPSKSDWMKFKVAGYSASYGNPMITAARLPLRSALVAYEGSSGRRNKTKPDETFAKTIFDYVRSQESPFLGALSDVVLREDPVGRTLPHAQFKEPIRLRQQGIEPYTWPEWAGARLLPIPAKEVWSEVWRHGFHYDSNEIKELSKAVGLTALQAGTGGRLTEDQDATQTKLTW